MPSGGRRRRGTGLGFAWRTEDRMSGRRNGCGGSGEPDPAEKRSSSSSSKAVEADCSPAAAERAKEPRKRSELTEFLCRMRSMVELARAVACARKKSISLSSEVVLFFPSLRRAAPARRGDFAAKLTMISPLNLSMGLSQERSSSQSQRSAAAGAPFLSISVTDPVKMGTGVQSYISYRVITKTNLPEFEGPEKIVIRRYSDFEWLHDRLAERYKGIFIPPLPEKNAVEKFRFSKEFIELRRQALDLFVNRIASHPELKQSDVLRTFLQADEEIMDRARSYETGIFKKPADFIQMFKDVQSKVSDVVLGKEKPVEESTPEYEKLKNYIFELENHLAEAQKQAYRLVKRHRELGQSLADFGKAIKHLGACEGDLMEKVFSEVGSKSEMLSIKLQREADNLLFNFEEPLKDYVRAVQSIKATMLDRANAFRQHFDLDQERKYKELNLEKLKFMNPEKYAEAESEFREASLL
ncbi:Sorting nexin 1 [Zea mays]|uniref:Sorting nexin 1 n=1 Tax=Zea mays TaxID=4577 RepID=A0A3L6FKJ2_MAIZE|nr:Sorting nexin 1 [Zea mays]